MAPAPLEHAPARVEEEKEKMENFILLFLEYLGRAGLVFGLASLICLLVFVITDFRKGTRNDPSR